MSDEIPVIAIIGAGPAGSALACLLALRGMRPVVFDDDKRKLLKHSSKHLIWGVEDAAHFAVH